MQHVPQTGTQVEQEEEIEYIDATHLQRRNERAMRASQQAVKTFKGLVNKSPKPMTTTAPDVKRIETLQAELEARKQFLVSLRYERDKWEQCAKDAR